MFAFSKTVLQIKLRQIGTVFQGRQR